MAVSINELAFSPSSVLISILRKLAEKVLDLLYLTKDLLLHHNEECLSQNLLNTPLDISSE